MHTINVMTYIYYPSLAYHTLSLVLGLVSQTILSLCVVSRLQVKLMATLSDFLRSWSHYSLKIGTILCSERIEVLNWRSLDRTYAGCQSVVPFMAHTRPGIQD